MNIIHCSVDGDGTTFGRPYTTHRVFIADCKGWDDLNPVQQQAVCELIWPNCKGEGILIKDPVTDQILCEREAK